MKKKGLAIACAQTMLASSVPARAADGIKVFVNNYEVVFQGQQPVIADGYTLIPVRGALEAMGVQVVWNEKEKSVLLTKDKQEAKLVIGKKSFEGGKVQLETPAQIIGGSTMIPLRAVAEYFNGHVAWDGKSKTGSITIDKKEDAYSAVTYKKDLKAANGTVLITGTVKYPQLNTETLGVEARAINDKIASWAKGSLESYLSENKELVTKEAGDLGSDFKTHDFIIDFETPYYKDNIFSFYSNQYTYTGGAHGNSYAKGFTYDLKAGIEKSLSNFVALKDTNAERAFLKNIIKDDIKQNPSKYFEGADKMLEESQADIGFYLTAENQLVVFISEAGVVSPYSSGIIRVEKKLALGNK
ncbi:MAG TPA: hypothetical protein DDW34_06155 [Clostridium sp.]|nr:hypothetical protein [Clostridium sp.]